ncbi:MAG: DUF2520 domain-containing protein [bacterium]|nr:DUF2520 domain-containing protein [bacterium]
MMRHFSVIGAGNLGTYLAQGLVNAGYDLSHIYKKSKYGQFLSVVTHDIPGLVKRSDFIVIAVQESRVGEVVELVSASPGLEGKIIFHTSNSLTSDHLNFLREKGAVVGSFSPLQTFPAFDPVNVKNVFDGVYFLAEGDSGAIGLVEDICVRLNAKLLRVDKDKKIYFHIAAVAASNFLISILKLSERQLRKAGNQGEPPDISVLLPLVRQTLKNVESKGVEESLTGPFKRKEAGVIERHLELLDKDDAALYKALTDFLGL